MEISKLEMSNGFALIIKWLKDGLEPSSPIYLYRNNMIDLFFDILIILYADMRNNIKCPYYKLLAQRVRKQVYLYFKHKFHYVNIGRFK
jgi:hypothetical protein